MSKDENVIIETEIPLDKETPGTDQYRTPKGEKPSGVRVLMLDKWVQENGPAAKVKVVVTKA